jgi:poly(3-hydroxybutyrate) depolymerase
VQSVERGDASGRAYTLATFRDDSGKSVLEHWVVHGGPHAWFGGSSEGSFTDPHGPDASREIVRFFLQHQSS